MRPALLAPSSSFCLLYAGPNSSREDVDASVSLMATCCEAGRGSCGEACQVVRLGGRGKLELDDGSGGRRKPTAGWLVIVQSCWPWEAVVETE